MEQIKSQTRLPRTLLIVLLALSFITTFACGYLLSSMLSAEKKGVTGKKPPVKNTPYVLNITPQPTTNNPQDTTKFLPGKFYFDDTIIAVTKDKPVRTIAATVTRIEKEGNYTQNSRMSYNDGKSWKRLSDSKTTPDSTIVSDELIKSWITAINPSRVLKQSVQGEFRAQDSMIKFDTGNLENEIGMRSLPGYTKFMSQGSGTLSIDGQNHPAYILYTRIYSLNASDIQFYSQPFGLTTDWVAFWDSKGNFYHVDKTNVDTPTPVYQTHSIGVYDSFDREVIKTFDLDIKRDSKNPPTDYTFILKSPIAKTLTFKRINSINKAPNSSFAWFMGNIEGTVSSDGISLDGIGLVEYIHD